MQDKVEKKPQVRKQPGEDGNHNVIMMHELDKPIVHKVR